MAFAAKILVDSVSEAGARLTTFEITYPRCIHSEFMTHRMISRNAASSRAIPVEKMIARVLEDPFIPIEWGANQKGMQAGKPLSPEHADDARKIWLEARDTAVEQAEELQRIGLHKQIVNRIVEPWMWITVVATATSWSNFFGLRCHPDAEPHFQKIAGMMRSAYDASRPSVVKPGGWHLPYINSEVDRPLAEPIARDIIEKENASAASSPVIMRIMTDDVLARVSVGRCARVSYLSQDGTRDLALDVALHERMKGANPGHWSPFEHVATALKDADERSGNFVGWSQYRKLFQDEHIGGRML